MFNILLNFFEKYYIIISVIIMLFICPVCKEKLHKCEKSYKCENNHCFDIAKQGYINLLTGSKGGNHGDNKLMTLARRDFLNKGYYEEFLNGIVNTVKEFSNENDIVLDCGCGEGYYTSEIANRIQNIKVYGFDISKDEISYAAKRNKNIEYAVASSFSIPVEDKSVDILLEIFSPHSEKEFSRILKPNGYMIMAIPLENHLYSLKSAIYDEPYKNEVADFNIEGYELVKNTEIKYVADIKTNEDIKNLFMMTPYYYKTGKNEQSRLNTLQTLSTELEFSILVYKKLG